MTNTETITVHPGNLALIDQSELGQEAAGYLWLLNAHIGRISEPDAEAREEGLPDLWMSEADWAAWEQHLVEQSHEERLISEYQDRMQDEEDYRNSFWD